MNNPRVKRVLLIVAIVACIVAILSTHVWLTTILFGIAIAACLVAILHKDAPPPGVTQ